MEPKIKYLDGKYAELKEQTTIENRQGRQIEITSNDNKAAAEDLLYKAWTMFILTHSDITPSQLFPKLMEIEQDGFSLLKDYLLKEDLGAKSEELRKKMEGTLSQGFCFMSFGK